MSAFAFAMGALWLVWLGLIIGAVCNLRAAHWYGKATAASRAGDTTAAAVARARADRWMYPLRGTR